MPAAIRRPKRANHQLLFVVLGFALIYVFLGVLYMLSQGRVQGSVSLYPILGFAAGLFCFIHGFRVYREYRVLADTPEIPIRSIPMGLVEVCGTATGERRLTRLSGHHSQRPQVALSSPRSSSGWTFPRACG